VDLLWIKAASASQAGKGHHGNPAQHDSKSADDMERTFLFHDHGIYLIQFVAGKQCSSSPKGGQGPAWRSSKARQQA